MGGEVPDGLPVCHAVLWSNGAISDLQTATCLSSEANSINSHHIIVGLSILPDGPHGTHTYHAIAWYAGKMIDLNELLPAGSHITLTMAVAINNADQVVCYDVDRNVILLQLHLRADKP
jgi:uncharacterized membrane protein